MKTLTGIRGSRGVFRGPARVLSHPREVSNLRPGEVLVVAETSPDWIDAFTILRDGRGAMVTEVGGATSHAAVTCREYRIPCVVGVAGARAALADQTVTVDGAAGVVRYGAPTPETVEVPAEGVAYA